MTDIEQLAKLVGQRHVWLGTSYKIKKLLLQVGGGVHELKITKNYRDGGPYTKLENLI